MKKVVQFDWNGTPMFVEMEGGEDYAGKDVNRGDDSEAEQAGNRFTESIAKIKPAAEAVLKTFKDLNTPAEINLEFGIKFNAKAGAIFASVDSEATFKVALKWKNS